ncbi:MAG: HAD-superfamily subfamily hydrolase [Candidatus Saccharibacteria bacterium]|nr:HAD-superfamily subfamily hydrolase [Candidatus Saccharibacteria bacterium]
MLVLARLNYSDTMSYMPKPFAALDVDGTIFKSSLAEKVVDACIDAKVFAAEPFNLVFANKRRWQTNNNEGVYQAYLHRLVRTFISQMAGIEVERFDRVIATMISEHSVRKFAFPRRLINSLQTSHHIVAISGSPDILVRPFLADLPVQTAFGSAFAVEDGIFTGAARAVGDKAAILQGLVAANVASQAGSVAVGDTFSDAPMLAYAETAIMFNASRTLTKYGQEFGWLRVNEVKDQQSVLEYNIDRELYEEKAVDVLLDRLRIAGTDEQSHS